MVGNPEWGGRSEAVRVRHQVVDALRHMYTVQELCSYLGVSRSGYYRYCQEKTQDRDQEVKQQILALFQQRKGIYGYRRIQMELEHQFGCIVNHKKVLRLMQEMGLRAIIRRKRNFDNKHVQPSTGSRVADNLLNRDFHAEAPMQKWVTDVTQFRVNEQRIYLSVIKDLFNNEIVAHHMSLRNDNALVLNTFAKVLKKRNDVNGLIVHSDQGFQYTSHEYHDMLLKVGARISMSRRGNCLDNAAMESFFSHLKAEALYPYDIRDLSDAQTRIEEYIRFYNEERVQRKLNKLTPVEYRRQLVA